MRSLRKRQESQPSCERAQQGLPPQRMPDEDEPGAVLGKAAGGWALLYSPKRGLLAEKIVEGYNDVPRKPIKGQSGHQMMLITDMVLLWDAEYRKVLEEYAEDEESSDPPFREVISGRPLQTIDPGGSACGRSNGACAQIVGHQGFCAFHLVIIASTRGSRKFSGHTPNAATWCGSLRNRASLGRCWPEFSPP